MSEAAESEPSGSPERKTGPLPAPSSPQLSETAVERAEGRDLFLRLAELVVFLLAVVGAVALGLGISDYFTEHAYIGAYLVAYGGFRIADLLVRENYGPDPVRDALGRRILNQLPLLLLFVAAPFERTYLYGGEPASWLGALGVLLELAGLWLALGARIQLGFFCWERTPEGGQRRALVKTGFYRFIRHPTFTGVLIALVSWPLVYGAPLAFILTLVVGILAMRRMIAAEEAELLARFGDEYELYRRTTDAVIPNLW